MVMPPANLSEEVLHQAGGIAITAVQRILPTTAGGGAVLTVGPT